MYWGLESIYEHVEVGIMRWEITPDKGYEVKQRTQSFLPVQTKYQNANEWKRGALNFVNKCCPVCQARYG